MSRRAFLIGLAVIGLLIFSLYRAKYGARESAEEIAAVEAEIADAIEERKVLLGELSHLSRQEWIEEFARNELGMVPARAEQFVRADDLDRVIGPAEKTDGEAGDE
ncbi:cell division protein FtsL [Henriciella mobilis]|uniref:Cell division protein FtsL n=1 Tax=Henriciella mobilis TaxID=2305467 RepID=A0A399RN60_9PROT|nr:septum formation initiator family protein [Henriciella mobilis]RIJ15912.1 cell division protein FtsL [Henriciella mobilis]RIJ21122.1 cell division protein FtsL [Henriciella mobilis]RIJ32638.1 cell division protein FtsL [Henriciella mobilis]